MDNTPSNTAPKILTSIGTPFWHNPATSTPLYHVNSVVKPLDLLAEASTLLAAVIDIIESEQGSNTLYGASLIASAAKGLIDETVSQLTNVSKDSQ